MYLLLVPIAWLFVVVLMALAEAMSPQGTVLGATFTFVLYGLLPLGIVMYILGTPARKQARARSEAEAEASTRDGHGGGHAPGGPAAGVAAEREEG